MKKTLLALSLVLGSSSSTFAADILTGSFEISTPTTNATQCETIPAKT